MRNTLLGAVLVALGAMGRPAAVLAQSPDPSDPALAAPATPATPADAGEPGAAAPPAASAPPVDEADLANALPEMNDPLLLRRSPRLDLAVPSGPANAMPVFLRADTVDGFLNGRISARGSAEVRQPGLAVTADRIDYTVPDERCVADGHVEVLRGLDRVTGPSGSFNFKDQTGSVQEPLVEMGAGPGRPREARASAAEVVFVDRDHEHLDQAAYTTCKLGDDAWFLTGSSVDLDNVAQLGVAHSARIVFEGVPLLYSPYLSFPLNDQRKSGFLAPTIGTTATSGLDFALPYYFNIAPNLDDTLTTRLMSKRGVQFGNEFRYLEPDFNGILTGELLNHDVLRGDRRYDLGWTHEQNLPYGIHFHAVAQEVSDSAYFRDLSSLVAATSTTYLPRNFVLSTARQGWTLSAATLDYQTIRDPTTPVADQYRMMPDLVANYSTRWNGLAVSVQNEYADFHHPTLQQGQRWVSYPSVALPLLRDWGYFTPKIGLHMTEYQTAALAASGLPGARLSRQLPISSIDTGLYFERELEVRGREITQTLEPRIYYLDIPYRNQSGLPVFNTGVADVNYSQLFSENAYSGPDRINDASQLTLGVQSRLLDTATGTEALRAVLGQRFYYRAQGVTLPGETARIDNVSDVIAGVTGRFSSAFHAEISTDFNPSLHRTEKFVAAGHWVPEPGKALNLGYNIDRDTPGQPDIRQIDFSTEWPVGGRWTVVARLDYDTAQSILVEGLAGAEYTAGCWVFRVVAHRYAVSTTQTSSAVFFQLELNGLARLGTNPLEALRLNIPGYRKTNELSQPSNTLP